MEFSADIRTKLREFVAVVLLGGFPLWLARSHWQSPWPWRGDAVSMVLPTAIARRQLAAGSIPLWSELYFQGESLLTPHTQLLYPPWWVNFLPLPLGDTLKLVVAAHFVAAPLIIYWYSRRARLPIIIAAGLGAAAALPLAGLSWHHQKTLGWPWLLLIAGQLLPWEWQNARRSGLIIGLSGGVMLLASSLYYAWYAALLVGPLFLLYRSRERWFPAVAGTLIGAPAIVFNILPYIGGARPLPGWWLTPPTLLMGLTGFGPPDRTLISGFQVWGVPFEGYAVVGVGVLGLSLGGLRAALRDGRKRWVAGLGVSACIGLTLAMVPLVYAFPVVSTFRTAGRANIMLALLALVFSIYACRTLVEWDGQIPSILNRDGLPGRRPVVTALTVFLLLNAATGAVAWQSFDRGNGTTLDESEALAASLPADCGDTVWNEMYQGGEAIPRGELGMALLDEGYRLDAVYYAAFGASYSVRTENDKIAFDLLLTPTRINGTEPLTGGSAQQVRGHISNSELQFIDKQNYRGETVYIYARQDACET